MPKLPPFPHIHALTASAGAGKTYALALRYLTLLADQPEPDPRALKQVLAITFTVAAAQEMKDRIIFMLKEIALSGDRGDQLAAQTGLDKEKAAAWMQIILNNYSHFQVKTIDSLHFQMLQALSRRFNLWPELKATFSESRYVGAALKTLLAKTDWPADPFSDKQKKTGSLLHLWDEMLDNYLVLENRRGIGFIDWLEKTSGNVFGFMKQKLTRLSKPSFRERDKAKTKMLDSAKEFYQCLESADLLSQVSYVNLDTLESIVTDPPRNFHRSFFHKESKEALFNKAALNSPLLEQCWRAYKRFARDTDAYVLIQARIRLAGFARLQDRLVNEINRLAEMSGLLLGGWWTRLLRERSIVEDVFDEVRLVLGLDWRHLLIDEFQDTSREQWEVLSGLAEEALSRGGSLFYVGDVKQAIYGWRGGDWRLFSLPLQPGVFPSVDQDGRIRETLTQNWRSCPEIVDFVNQTFAGLNTEQAAQDLARLMTPQKNDICLAALTEAVAELYSSARQTAVRSGQGEIIFRHVEDEDEKPYREVAAAGLAREILDTRSQEIAWKDMAVLVRTARDAKACAETLMNAGIPTVTEQSLRLEHSPLIRGLLSMLYWLENPEDILALQCFCASGLIPGGFAAARAVMHPEKADCLEEVKKRLPKLWTRYLEPLWNRAGLYGTYDLLNHAIELLDLRSRPPGEWTWVEKLLETAFQAEEEGAYSPAGFIKFWESESADLGMTLPETLDAVKVLTVHKAKGLEFPVVFLPLLTWPDMKRLGTTYLQEQAEDGSLYVVCAKGKGKSKKIDELDQINKSRDLAESLNLLYVALTRAKNRLYIFLDATKSNGNKNPADKWLKHLADLQTA